MDSADGSMPPLVSITVLCSPAPGTVESVVLRLGQGSVVADAIAQSGFARRHRALEGDAVRVGVWGALCDRATALQDGDRVEVYRPLAADPKDARRARGKVAATQAARAPRAPRAARSVR